MDSATRSEVAEAMKLVKKIIGNERIFALAVMDRPSDPRLAPEMAIFGDVPVGMSPDKAKPVLAGIFSLASMRLQGPPPAGQARVVEERPM